MSQQTVTEIVQIKPELYADLNLCWHIILIFILLFSTQSVPRREEGSTGKYQHEVKGVPEGAARGNPSTECWYFTVLPDSSQGTGITQFIMLLLLLYRLEKATLVGAELVLENTIERMVSTVRVIIQYASFRNWVMFKTSQDCKTLPRVHLISCQGVKLFLPKKQFEVWSVI